MARSKPLRRPRKQSRPPNRPVAIAVTVTVTVTVTVEAAANRRCRKAPPTKIAASSPAMRWAKRDDSRDGGGRSTLIPSSFIFASTRTRGRSITL